MYSVRKYARGHGNTNLNMLFLNLGVTAVFIWQFGMDYLVIFCSSTLLILVIETGLSLSGIRKGVAYVHGHELPRVAALFLRALVDGPAICVPAFFVADQFLAGRMMVGIAGATAVVGFGSLYSGLADRRDLRQLGPGKQPLVTRRAMTKPWAGPAPRLHQRRLPDRAVPDTRTIPNPCLHLRDRLFVSGHALLCYQLPPGCQDGGGDAKRGEYTMPGPFVQAVGLAFYLGLFQFATLT